MKALIYARLACYDKKGLEAQVEHAKHYCRQQNIEVLDVLMASPFTAKCSNKKESYKELLTFVKKYIQKDLVLVVRDYSRIGRDVQSDLAFEKFCSENGIKIISLANLNDKENNSKRIDLFLDLTIALYKSKSGRRKTMNEK